MATNSQGKAFKESSKARLTRAFEFHAVRKSGKSYGGKFLVLGHLEQEEGGVRYGLITSKRVGKAHERNFIRRRMREILRADLGEIEGNHWLVLIARVGAKGASYQELREDWRKLARKAKILEKLQR